MDELVRALGMSGISKSEVSRLCAELDEKIEAFHNRPLEGEYPYVWEDDILACMAFPCEHWRQIYSTNTLERLNREISRRTDVVGIFPNRQSLI